MRDTPTARPTARRGRAGQAFQVHDDLRFLRNKGFGTTVVPRWYQILSSSRILGHHGLGKPAPPCPGVPWGEPWVYPAFKNAGLLKSSTQLSVLSTQKNGSG